MGGCGGGAWRQPSFEDAEIQLSVWRRRQIPKERPLQRLCSTQDHVHMLFVIMPKRIVRFRKSMVWPTPFAVFPWALLYVPACSGANGRMEAVLDLKWHWSFAVPLEIESCLQLGSTYQIPSKSSCEKYPYPIPLHWLIDRYPFYHQEAR